MMEYFLVDNPVLSSGKTENFVLSLNNAEGYSNSICKKLMVSAQLGFVLGYAPILPNIYLENHLCTIIVFSTLSILLIQSSTSQKKGFIWNTVKFYECNNRIICSKETVDLLRQIYAN